MAKFAKKANIRTRTRSHADAERNLEEGLSFKWDDKSTLYARVACSLVNEPTFYKNVIDGNVKPNFDDDLVSDIKKVSEKDPEFLLKLASYARNELYLRSVPMLLIGEASQIPKARPFIKKWAASIIKRADEPAELMSYVINRFGRNAATSNNQLKKGIAASLDKFNEYQFAKYNRSNAIKLKDVLRICHPKHKDIYKKIIENTLETPDTWEVLISNPESKGFKTKKEAWEYLVNNNKLGYMAMLRNIRNLIKEDVSQATLDKALNFISDKQAVLKSKQLPFRFLSAYREIEGSKKISTALETALEHSIENIPKLSGTTFISADTSGSMNSKLSSRSSITLDDIACLMATMADKFCDDSYASVFATEFKTVKTNTRSSILENAERFKSIDVGYSTNGYLILDHLVDKRLKVDRIMIFTDMQMYDSDGYDRQFIDSFIRYKRAINPNVKLYCINLSTYGNVVVPHDEPNVCLLSGWSENIFKFINIFESDRKTAVSEIEKLKPIA